MCKGICYPQKYSSRAVGRGREISMDPTNGECNKLKPFGGANGEPLNVN